MKDQSILYIPSFCSEKLLTKTPGAFTCTVYGFFTLMTCCEASVMGILGLDVHNGALNHS